MRVYIILLLIQSFHKTLNIYFLQHLCIIFNFSNHIKIFRSFSDSEGRLRGPVLQYSISSTIGGFQRRPNKIHFENNTPFAVFKEVTKVIEVNLLIFNLTINRFHIGEILISKNFINLPMKERPLRVNILELTSVLTIEILVKINYSQ